MKRVDSRNEKIEFNENLAKNHGVTQTYMLIKINSKTKESSLIRNRVTKEEADRIVKQNNELFKDFTVIGFPSTKHANEKNDYVVFKNASIDKK